MIRGAEAVIFDFDGTLVDASAAICASFNAVVERHGRAPLADGTIREMIGRPLRDMFPCVFPEATAAQVAGFIDEYREAFTPICRSLSRPMPGVLDVVPLLASRLKLAIATSRTGPGALFILEDLGLAGCFAAVVGIGDVTECKPHPESVEVALRRMEVPARHAVMVGDTTDDVLAGRAAGTATVGVSADAGRRMQLETAGADYVLESLQELTDILPPHPRSAVSR